MPDGVREALARRAAAESCCKTRTRIGGAILPSSRTAAQHFVFPTWCSSSCLATETELCAGTAFDCPAAAPTCLGATVHVGADALRVGRCVAKTP